MHTVFLAYNNIKLGYVVISQHKTWSLATDI